MHPQTLRALQPILPRFLLAIILIATACASSDAKSDSYSFGYQVGVDWVNATESIAILVRNKVQLRSLCWDFEKDAAIASRSGKTFEQMMRDGYIGRAKFITDPVPTDLNQYEFVDGCMSGVESTNQGAFMRN